MISVYIIAAEPSGDLIGAELMRGLKQATNGDVSFAGIGGPAMAEEGLDSRFDMSELTLIGVFEVLPKAMHVLKRVKETVSDIERLQPDVLLTIDAWGFTGRVHKALAKRNSPVIRVRAGAPQVWAWRPGRAKDLAGWIHHLLTLFAFEPQLFERYGLTATWIGHPVAEAGFGDADGAAFRAAHGLNDTDMVLGVLPGSRRREVTTLLPIFKDAVRQLPKTPDAVVIPLVSGLEHLVNAVADDWPCRVIKVPSKDKVSAFAAMDAAIAASGTVTLELALAGVPHAIAYKVNWLTGVVLRHMATTPFANLINIITKRSVIPELLMARCAPEPIAEALKGVMGEEDMRQGQRKAFREVASQLRRGDARPGKWAADVILNLVRKR